MITRARYEITVDGQPRSNQMWRMSTSVRFLSDNRHDTTASEKQTITLTSGYGTDCRFFAVHKISFSTSMIPSGEALEHAWRYLDANDKCRHHPGKFEVRDAKIR
jgi:hypothetical protein